LENLKKRDNLEDLSKDRRTVLKWILKKRDGRFWTILIWPGIKRSGGLL